MAKSFEESVLNSGGSGVQMFTLSASEDEVFSYISGYQLYTSYDDTNISTVNEQKVVTLSPNQPNLTQEENSQYIPFEMPRYYDGIDLSSMVLQFHYVNPNGDEFFDSPVNVQVSKNKIRLGWLVKGNATAFAGELDFEITASGTTNAQNGSLQYLWRTKTNKALIVEQSLSGNGIIKPEDYNSWYTTFVATMNEKVATASNAATRAENVLNSLETEWSNLEERSEAYIDGLFQDMSSLKNLGVSYKNNTLTFYDKTKDPSADDYKLTEVSISTLSNLNMTYTSTSEGVTTLSIYDGDTLIKSLAMDIIPSARWQSDFSTSIGASTDSKISTYVDPKIAAINQDLTSIHGQIDNLPQTLQNDYYTKTQVDDMLEGAVTEEKLDEMISANEEFKRLSAKVTTAEENVNLVDGRVDTLSERVEEVAANTTAHNTYDIRYDLETNHLNLYENVEDPDADDAVPKTTVTIVGGGGGGSQTGSTMTLTRITPDTITEKSDATSILIRYNFTSVMADGDTNSITGTATWRVGNTIVAVQPDLQQGDLSFEVRSFLSVGTNRITLTMEDSEGNRSSRRWTVNLINFDISSTFDDTLFYDSDISFRYTPNGNISKVVHFVLDGEEIASVTTTSTAKQLTQNIPMQSHGQHLLDLYMTATINDVEVTSNHVYKDIIFVDSSQTTPIISCPTRSFSSKQYNTTPIVYTVYDPLSNPATVKLYIDDQLTSTLNVNRASQTWSFKSSDVGEHELKIEVTNSVATASVIIGVTIIDIGINVAPITDNLIFDFNPAGRSNADASRVWTDGTYSMTVSSNFDWANGGYQIDADGDTYFCVKAGTTASFNVPLLGDRVKIDGRNFKFVYRTNNVRDYDAKVLECMSDGIGLEMYAQNAILHSQQNQIEVPYCEDNFMEFEFNILPSAHFREMVLWLDAIPTRVKLYETTDVFEQNPVVPITIGSNDCDVWVYRMKSYSAYLEEDEVLTNFIADAKNAEEMLLRYERNNILNDGGQLDPDLLADRCPDLRIIKLSAPYFTNDKDNKVSNTTVQHIYKNGRAVEDNWTATGGIHKGQGTSSNYYGDSARNIDIDFRKAYNVEAGTGFLYGDGTLHAKYGMTANSVPEAYFNIKLNVASSENANNAVLAEEYNTFNPYIRPAREADSRVRDTMEFHPCVVFIKETDPDMSTHRVFTDNDWHFYGCGDFGNSKKNNAAMGMTDDPAEFIMEINNNINDQCRWLSDDVTADGDPTTWGSKTSFQLRYIQDEDDAEMVTNAANVWKSALTWVVSQYRKDSMDNMNAVERLASLDAAVDQAIENLNNGDGDADAVDAATQARDNYIASFKNRFEQRFQADNLCFSYLFTERHLMIDNRAKNTFWHYDPTTEKLSCCFDYDNDTAEGNDNEGGLTLRYGLEDTDTIGTKDVFNAADSYIWKLIKNFYRNDLAVMYRDLEDDGAWSATRFLNKMEAYQSVKPERLWIMDMQRKYFRPYEEGGITEATDSKPSTTAYLDMMHGSKKHQRRQFEKYQEKYIASKYVGVAATSDVMTLRTYTPTEWTGVRPSTTFHITPYADTYIVVLYGSHQVSKRAKRGQTYEITAPSGVQLNDTETYTYNASMLQSLGDLSAFYPGYVNLAGGVKLRDLLIGSSVEGYANTNFTSVSVSNNPLLERLNLQNLPNLAVSINVESCVNMTQLLADGSAITGVVFPTGGKITTAHLPATITSITAKSLNYLSDLQIAGYSNITTLFIEDSPQIDALALLNNCTNLKSARFVGINWVLSNDSTLERIYGLTGQDENYNSTPRAILTGNVNVETIHEQNYNKYRDAWPNLTISYTNMIRQYRVQFLNKDGSLLEQQYVDVNTRPVDPSTRAENPIIPHVDSTISTVYTFDTWDHPITIVTGEQVYIATFTETPRTYTVTYVQNPTGSSPSVLQRTTNVPYGKYVPYIGKSGVYDESATFDDSTANSDIAGFTARAAGKKEIIPTYTEGEGGNDFYLFRGWDKSGYVDGYASEGVIGDKTITAQFDRFHFESSGNTNSFTDSNGNWRALSDLSPVEIYAMAKLQAGNKLTVNNDNEIDTDDFVSIGDQISIRLGSDANYDDLSSHEFITMDEPRSFDGYRDYFDTADSATHSEHSKILETDQDFIIALEYTADSNIASGAVLLECYNDYYKSGLRIYNNNGITVDWFNSSQMIGSIGMRDLIVLRHVKGERTLRVYTVNQASENIGYFELANNSTGSALLDKNMVIGCIRKTAEDSYENFFKGTVHWCKIWHGDLGDAVCREMVSWTHETKTFRVAKYRDYFKVNSSQRTITFIADDLLPSGRSMGSYKWSEASLNRYLQNRIFFAFPAQWQAIMTEIVNDSWDGIETITYPNGSSENIPTTTVTRQKCFISIPCAAELDSSAASDTNFAKECEKGIIKFVAGAGLLKYYPDGSAGGYWTRTPSSQYKDYMMNISVSYSGGTATARLNEFQSPGSSLGVLIMFTI